MDYLALGDSVAFGYTPPQVTPPSNYFDAANFHSYADDVAASDSLKLTNASCSGETTASLLTAGAQSNGCENSVGSPYGYRSFFPLHVDYSGTQLTFAVKYLLSHPRTRLITIDIGANDLFVCQQTTADNCTGADFGAQLRRTADALSAIFSAIRGQAHYNHDLVLLSYYSLSYTDPVQLASTNALNATLAAVTSQYGGVVADGYGAFEQASASAGGDPCRAGLLIPLPTGGCNIHPTAYGHSVLASAIQAAVPAQGR